MTKKNIEVTRYKCNNLGSFLKTGHRFVASEILFSCQSISFSQGLKLLLLLRNKKKTWISKNKQIFELKLN